MMLINDQRFKNEVHGRKRVEFEEAINNYIIFKMSPEK